MSGFELTVGEAVVETEAEEFELRGTEPAIRDAFRLLAEHIERTPFRHFGGARTKVLESLRVTALPLDELLGPRGAERLAEELYRELAQTLET